MNTLAHPFFFFAPVREHINLIIRSENAKTHINERQARERLKDRLVMQATQSLGFAVLDS